MYFEISINEFHSKEKKRLAVKEIILRAIDYEGPDCSLSTTAVTICSAWLGK
jgi:hypothetical protein